MPSFQFSGLIGLPHLFAFSINAILGIIAVSCAKRRMVYVVYALFCSMVCLWTLFGHLMFYEVGETNAVWLARVVHVGVVALPVLFMHFTFLLTRAGGRVFFVFLMVMYLLAGVLMAGNLGGYLIAGARRTVFCYYGVAGPMYPLLCVYVLLTIGWSIWQLAVFYRGASSAYKGSVLLITGGLVVALLGGLNDFLPFFVESNYPFTSIPVYPFGALAIGIYGVCVTIAILKLQLVEWENSERLKSVGILAAGMAHEIKNPVTTLKTFIEHLPVKYEDAGFRERFVRLAGEEVGRMERLVRGLLDFSRPKEPVRKSFDLNVLMDDVLGMLTPRLDTVGVRVEFVKGRVPEVHADPDQVKQAIFNILLNAVDALSTTEGERKIRLESAEHDRQVRLSIADNGPGISRENIKHVFDPFHTSKEDGTGLGLAITQSLVRRNYGRILVQSSREKGTSFVIYLRSAGAVK